MKKILIANRGEIALRIVRACRDAGYRSVAIASEADRNALHARSADEVYVMAGNSSSQTYLNQEAILSIAAAAGADAVHPGYGLLSENETFAAAVEAAGLTWIGPPAAAIAALGDKVSARALAQRAEVRLLPSFDEPGLTAEKAAAFAERSGYPVIVKAQNGGGGRGMRIVREASEIAPQLAAAEREAGIAFGRSDCFIERYVERARHVETQCLIDSHGTVAVLSTRDCTLQRRQQKLVEEAPAPFLSAAQADELVASSRKLLSAVGYRGAATCEFLVTPEGDIFFLEVNTRVQVEHPVTEEVTGLDIIREMFRIAEGEALSAETPALRGHSIEFRINAEDPWSEFQPTPGRITTLVLPGGPGVRTDFGYGANDTVPPFYDSLVGKLIVTGRDRREALARARRALDELEVGGIRTVTPLHRAILDEPDFAADDLASFAIHTRWIDSEADRLLEAASTHLRTEPNADPTMTGKGDDEVRLSLQEAAPANSSSYRIGIQAPLSGLVLDIAVKEGDRVAIGDAVAIMESMKMEQTILAEVGGTVASINVGAGSFIDIGDDIVGLD